MMIASIIAISVIVYSIAGMATATLVILADGEPASDDYGLIFPTFLFWPIWLSMYLPLLAARWIKARQEASREKTPASWEEDEP